MRTERKSDHRTNRGIVKQLRKIDEFTDLPQECVVERREKWRTHCRTLSNDRTTSCWKISCRARKTGKCKVESFWTDGQSEMNTSKSPSKSHRPEWKIMANKSQRIAGRSGVVHGNQWLAGRMRKKREVVMRPNQMGAALTQPWWSSLSRWGNTGMAAAFVSSKESAEKDLRCSISQRLSLQCMSPKGTRNVREEIK